MRTLGTFLSYAAGIAILIGGVAVASVPSQPATKQPAQSTQPAELKLSSSPRIAAWQERVAEEKLYAEREAARVAEEKARWAALGKPPMTQAVNETRTRELEEREPARARQTQREALRAQQEYARQNDPFGFAPTAYAPAPNRSRYNMRESRGGN